MRTVPMGEAACEGDPIHYALLVETLENGLENYGVQVEYRTQSAMVAALTLCRRRAEVLVERLRRGSVTPVALRDVAEDWLLE